MTTNTQRDRATLPGLTIDDKPCKPTMFVGATFHTERLGKVRVVRIHKPASLGTVDVVKVGTDDHYRISGLWFDLPTTEASR